MHGLARLELGGEAVSERLRRRGDAGKMRVGLTALFPQHQDEILPGEEFVLDIDQGELVESHPVGQAKTDLLALVRGQLGLAGPPGGIAVVDRTVGIGLHGDNGRLEGGEGVEQLGDLRLTPRREHVVRLGVVHVTARIGEVIGAEDHHFGHRFGPFRQLQGGGSRGRDGRERGGDGDAEHDCLPWLREWDAPHRPIGCKGTGAPLSSNSSAHSAQQKSATSRLLSKPGSG